MLRTNLLCGFMWTLALTAPGAIANAQDDGWHLRLGGVLVEPDAHFTGVDSAGNGIGIGASGTIGLGLALERRFSRRLGLELGALFAEPDVNLNATLAEGSQFNAGSGVNLRSITLGLNIHLTPDKPVDLYVGPFLAHVTYGNLRFASQFGEETIAVDVSSSDNFTYGAQFGADVAFGDSPWSLNLAARYLDSSLDVVTGDERVVSQLDFDALIVGVGIGYRF